MFGNWKGLFAVGMGLEHWRQRFGSDEEQLRGSYQATTARRNELINEDVAPCLPRGYCARRGIGNAFENPRSIKKSMILLELWFGANDTSATLRKTLMDRVLHNFVLENRS